MLSEAFYFSWLTVSLSQNFRAVPIMSVEHKNCNVKKLLSYMFSTAAYMYLPSLSDMTIRDTVKTTIIISNTATPLMIETAFHVHVGSFIIEFRLKRIVIQCPFGCLYSVCQPINAT